MTKRESTIRRQTQHDWRLLRYLLRHMVIGVISGWIFAASLLAFNISGLGDLATGSPAGILAAAMLFIVIAITWGSAAMGTAIFLIEKDNIDSGRKCPVHSNKRAPAPILALAKR